ncbi:heterogeneous nuclear ribonucleoprotein [Cyclospora cayetanensis]|uniref:Heterogeneous nuclear ribonucleoprotein n=1 Tax=Cyclospora cayetanensis TaxID=88456 RepID=A0A1D3CSQ5_9EIME|nr:heterogeneous nuclear ribonucleoprotein [Cyclospora cayetanensis]
MSAEGASNGSAAAQQQQQHLEEDAGIPQLPGASGGDDVTVIQGATTGQDGSNSVPSQVDSGYGGSSYQQQQQGGGDGPPQGGLTEEERTVRKIFVGGLNRSTTAESLREYFSTFGPVHHTEVLFDKLTGRSRGFGFVTFEEAETINNVVDRHHTIDDSQDWFYLCILKRQRASRGYDVKPAAVFCNVAAVFRNVAAVFRNVAAA